MSSEGACDPVPGVPGDTLFHQAMLCALTRWDPVKFVVNEGARGEDTPDILVWMPEVIAEFIVKQKDKLEPTDLEAYILDIMEAEFNFEIDDGGAFFLVKQAIQFWQDCTTGDTAELRRYVDESQSKRLYSELFGRYGDSGPRGPRGDSDLADDLHAMDLGPDADSAMLDDDQDGDVDGDEPEVDPDGWEVVTSKKKTGGRR